MADFMTAREQVSAKYVGASNYHASTEAVRSRLPFSAEFIGRETTTDVAYLRFKAGQEARFFGYKSGDMIADGFGGQRASTELDTNIKEANRIDGDMAIEEVSFSNAGTFIQYGNTDIGNEGNAEIKAAMGGKTRLYDPGCLVKPRQFESPFTSEDAIFQALLPAMLFHTAYRLNTAVPFATGLEISSADSKSGLHQNGCCEGRYRIPAGLIWTSNAQDPNRELQIRAKLVEDVIIPVNLVRLFGASGGTANLPEKAAVLCELRVRGLWLRPGPAVGAC